MFFSSSSVSVSFSGLYTAVDISFNGWISTWQVKWVFYISNKTFSIWSETKTKHINGGGGDILRTQKIFCRSFPGILFLPGKNKDITVKLPSDKLWITKMNLPFCRQKVASAESPNKTNDHDPRIHSRVCPLPNGP